MKVLAFDSGLKMEVFLVRQQRWGAKAWLDEQVPLLVEQAFEAGFEVSAFGLEPEKERSPSFSAES